MIENPFSVIERRLNRLESLLEEINRNTSCQIDPFEAQSPYGDFKWLTTTCSGIPSSTLRQWDAAGKIPGSAKFGKRKLYHKQTVLTWLHAQTSQKLPTTLEDEFQNQFDFHHKRTGGRKAS
jgi:hypothetical protein